MKTSWYQVAQIDYDCNRPDLVGKYCVLKNTWNDNVGHTLGNPHTVVIAQGYFTFQRDAEQWIKEHS